MAIVNQYPSFKGDEYPPEAYRKGDYSLNHYDRNSHGDKICLARDLHRWALRYSAQQSVHLTAFGVGMLVRLGSLLVRFGFYLCKIGGR